jgi:hypothetical protein
MNALSAIEMSSVAKRFNIVEFVSPRMFAELTSLSRFKLQELIKSGHIRAKRADGRILIEVASVNEYIASLPAETYADNEAQQDGVQAFNYQMTKAKTDLFE